MDHECAKWARRAAIGALAASAAAGCARGERAAPARAAAAVGAPVVSTPSAPAPRARPSAAPDETYWRAVDAPIRATLRAPELPLTDARVVRLEGADARWTAAPAEARARLKNSGFAVIAAGGARGGIGEYYAALRASRVPTVVTMDAMIAVAHVALDRMLAAAEARAVIPALFAFLARVDTRLAAESRKATTDLAAAYATARATTAVARALAEPGYVPAPELASAVADDVGRVLAHAGPAPSAALGVSLDFAQLAPRCALGERDAAADPYRALAWLGHAALVVASRAEIAGAPVDASQARDHMRAALLFARLAQPDVDAQGALSYDAVARPLALVAGPPDDPSLRDVARVALAAGLDVRDAAAIQNVARVDRARRALVERAAPRAYDGAGALRVAPGTPLDFTRAAAGPRVFGGAATPDAAAMQAMVAPAVPDRALPRAEDVAAWLGSREARGAPEDARHASVVASGLDAMGAFLDASRADGALPAAASSAWRARKSDVALGGWATLRHDAVALARAPLASAPPAPPARTADARALPAFVEPHPEAIARLVGTVEQAARGLAALGALAGGPPPDAARAIELLRACLTVALREANDEPIAPEEAAALAPVDDVPSAPLVVDVHADAAGARALEEGTGPIDDMLLVVREPGSGRLVLAVGASVARYEQPQPAGLRLNDEAWRALLAVSPPPRGPFSARYVLAP